MRVRVRVLRTQAAEKLVRAADEAAALDRIREELAQPYGFFGRWETVATDVEILDIEPAPGVQAKDPGDGPLLMSIKDAATFIGLSRATVYELASSGELPTVRIGRRRLVSREAIRDFIALNTKTGQ